MNRIVTHANCVDGYLSALILRLVHPSADLVRRQHSDGELDLVYNTLFCDISPPLHQAQELFEIGAYVLDHHRSALPVFEKRNARGVYAAGPGLSGASLAYEYAGGYAAERYGGNRLLELKNSTHLLNLNHIVQMVGIYDTWEDTHPRFERACEVHAALDFAMRCHDMDAGYGEGGGVLLNLLSDWNNYWSRVGHSIWRQTKEKARKLAEAAVVRVIELEGREVRVGVLLDGPSTAAFNLASNMVEADVVLASAFAEGEVLADPRGLLESDQAKIRVSLRSRGAVDCAKLAEHFGGGGHRGAAGFSLPREGLVRPAQLALLALEQRGPRAR